MIINPYVYDVSGGTDPYFLSVVALLHMDGSDGSTTFIDETGKTWTTSPSAEIDTAESKFGGASGYFPGGGAYIDTPDSADWDFGTGDFTVEYWVRLANITSLMGVVGNRDLAGDGWEVYHNNGNGVVTFIGDGTVAQTTTNVVSATTWTHIAVTRSGTDTNIYVNGVNKDTATCTTGNVAHTLVIGRRAYDFLVAPLNGHLDDLRITKGVARYTGNTLDTTYFTPHTTAHPNS